MVPINIFFTLTWFSHPCSFSCLHFYIPPNAYLTICCSAEKYVGFCIMTQMFIEVININHFNGVLHNGWGWNRETYCEKIYTCITNWTLNISVCPYLLTFLFVIAISKVIFLTIHMRNTCYLLKLQVNFVHLYFFITW